MAVILVLNTILIVPLALGALLPERSGRASLGALAFVAGATALEMPVVAALVGGAGAAPFWLLVITLNLCQAVWVLGVLLLVRAAGCRLTGLNGTLRVFRAACR
jgi:hypothetical protein